MLSNKHKIKLQSRFRRQLRTRAKINGTSQCPRLNVSKSLNHVFLQLIDDIHGKTLVSLHSKSLKMKGTKTEIAQATGKKLAQQALAQGIKTCIFDRGPAKYHGRVKAAAEGARQGGLKF